MSSQPTSEQESELSKFMGQPAYESIGCSYHTLCKLFEKHDPSFIETKLNNSFNIDSDKLGLEIFGCHVGKVMVNPDTLYRSRSDWFSMPLCGYIINYSGSDGINNTLNDEAYLFLNELQNIFSEVGTAKDPRWIQDKIDISIEKKQKLPFPNVLLFPFIVLEVFLSYKSQHELYTVTSNEDGIFKIFNEVYRNMKKSTDEDSF